MMISKVKYNYQKVGKKSTATKKIIIKSHKNEHKKCDSQQIIVRLFFSYIYCNIYIMAMNFSYEPIKIKKKKQQNNVVKPQLKHY